MATTETTVETSATPTDLGLMILRLGVGAAMVQAGLIKVFDFSTTAGFMESGGWKLPTMAALMVTVAEIVGGIGLILGLLTPLSACAVVGAGAYSVDATVFGRQRWSPKIAVGLLVLAFAVAIVTWVLLNGTNPIHISSSG